MNKNQRISQLQGEVNDTISQYPWSFSIYIKCGTMIKFLPLEFWVYNRIPWKNKNAVYRLQISTLVPKIFKFEK